MLNESFTSAQWVKHTLHCPGEDDAEIKERIRLYTIAAQRLEIEAQFIPGNSEIKMRFKNVCDRMLFLERILHGVNEDNVLRFDMEGIDPETKELWSFYADRALNEMGMSHTIEDREDAVWINLPSMMAHEVFSMLCHTGIFLKKAELHRKLHGPLPQEIDWKSIPTPV